MSDAILWAGLAALFIALANAGRLLFGEPRRASSAQRGPDAEPRRASDRALPFVRYEEDEGHAESLTGNTAMTLPAVPLAFDPNALCEDPTGIAEFALSASARTDRGLKRRQNEDSFILSKELRLFVVADGMGGHRGGAVASNLAVRTILGAIAGEPADAKRCRSLPSRASKLLRAIQMANRSVRHLAALRRELAGMGTTVVAALFSPEKGRMYLGHVGDSRCYRLRCGALQQMTSDHTMASLGVKGPAGAHLARAVGSHNRVRADLIVAAPHPGDVYLLCSDGLTKMVPEQALKQVLIQEHDDDAAAAHLVRIANERGGLDNITAVVVRVLPATGMLSTV